MSIEFVEPEPTPPAVATPPAAPTSSWPGRAMGVAAAVAGGLTIAGVQLTLYAVVRTAAIVDFDGTTYRVSRIPVDAFGEATPVRVTSTSGLALSDITPTTSVPDGISYGPWWIGLGVVLLLAAAWSFGAPRSARPAAVVAAAGGVLLGSLGAAWLAARTVVGTSVPQIRFAAAPAPGLWLLVAAGALALFAGLARALTPGLRLPRRRTDVPPAGAETA